MQAMFDNIQNEECDYLLVYSPSPCRMPKNGDSTCQTSFACLLGFAGAINKLVECFRMFHNGHFWDGV